MNIQPIRTDADYKASLRQISTLMVTDPEPGTPEGDRLDILATLVQAYEARYIPIGAPDPVEAIKFQPDLVLSDIHMDPMDGIEFVKRRRALPNPYFAHVPVIMMTADTSKVLPNQRK